MRHQMVHHLDNMDHSFAHTLRYFERSHHNNLLSQAESQSAHNGD